MNWSEFINQLLKDFRLSENLLAQRTGLTQTTVNRISTGKTVLPYQTTIRLLEEGLQIKIDDRDPENITYKKLKPEIPFDNVVPTQNYPILATVYAGEAGMLEHEHFDETVPFAYIKPGHRCFALRVSGHSMETTLRDGDIVLADMDIPLIDGCLVAVKLKNGNQYIKRYYDMNYTFAKLTSDNSEYGVRLIEKNDIVACIRIVSVLFAI